MTPPRQYEIRTVADFAKVPARRRARCLSEFATWLKMHDDVIALLTPHGLEWFAFTWIDDGKRKLTVEFWGKKKP